MSQTEIRNEHFLPLSKALSMLPSLKPRVAAGWLNDCYDQAILPMDTSGGGTAFLDPLVSIDMNGITVLTAELDELCELAGSNLSKSISPAGAGLLLRLYQSNVFPDRCVRDKDLKAPLQQFVEYAEGRGQIIDEALDRQKQTDAADAKRKFLIANPDIIPESEFKPGLLDEVFWAHLGPCSTEGQSMVIGGIAVRKSLSRYSSNSGKTGDFAVSLHWTGSDGRVRTEQVAFSRHAGNRRNDAERNWGLPE